MYPFRIKEIPINNAIYSLLLLLYGCTNPTQVTNETSDRYEPRFGIAFQTKSAYTVKRDSSQSDGSIHYEIGLNPANKFSIISIAMDTAFESDSANARKLALAWSGIDPNIKTDTAILLNVGSCDRIIWDQSVEYNGVTTQFKHEVYLIPSPKLHSYLVTVSLLGKASEFDQYREDFNFVLNSVSRR